MLKTASVRQKKLRIQISDKEGLLNSYIINSTSTNLHLIYKLTIVNASILQITPARILIHFYWGWI